MNCGFPSSLESSLKIVLLREAGIVYVELDETPAEEPSPKALKERVIFYVIVGLVYTIPFAALYGFYHFFKLIF